MEYDRAQELEINRHLRLEIETLRSPKRIERIATEELGLVAPTGDEAFVVQRVVPVDADQSVVATRRGEVLGLAEARP